MKSFFRSFVVCFSCHYSSASGRICELFLRGMAMGRSSGYCVGFFWLGRALWGLCHLQGRGVTNRIRYVDEKFKQDIIFTRLNNWGSI